MKIFTATIDEPNRVVRGATLPIEFSQGRIWQLRKPGPKDSYPCRIDNDLLASQHSKVLADKNPLNSHTNYQLAVESVTVMTEMAGKGASSNRVLAPAVKLHPSAVDTLGDPVLLWIPCVFTHVKEILNEDGSVAFDPSKLPEQLGTADAYKNFVSNGLVAVAKGQTVITKCVTSKHLRWTWNGRYFTVNDKPAANNGIVWA